MKLRDLSIRKKLILSNLMMVAIPVFIIIVILGSILLSFFVITGTGSRSGIMTITDGTISNYQLQLVFDSMYKEISHNKDWKSDPDFLSSCAELEKAGAQVLIYDDSSASYLTKGVTAGELKATSRRIAGTSTAKSFFFRGETGLVYQTAVQSNDREPLTILVTSEKLGDSGNGLSFLSTAERYVKSGIVLVGGIAIIIILLTGILLAEMLSKMIVTPLNQLRKAANEIKNGDLDSQIDFTSQDELGQICRDFDDMRLRLKESKQLQKKYEEGRKELIAGISHDLSTPLTSIKGYVSGLMEGIANTPEKREHYLRTVYDTACSMEQLVESLFLFSKLDLGRIRFSPETVDLVGYFEDYCAEMQNQLLPVGMRLSFSNRCGGKAEVRIDRLQFNRVLANLIDNSVKYKKEEPGEIEITLEDLQKDIGITFADNGQGISSGEAEKIFDSFYRTDPARSNTAKGSGLGLSIVKQIVEHMGGHIWARGRLNEGLTIVITLPKAEEEGSE